jgi:hypothetical protein
MRCLERGCVRELELRSTGFALLASFSTSDFSAALVVGGSMSKFSTVVSFNDENKPMVIEC